MKLLIGGLLTLLVLGTGEIIARRINPADPCMRRDELLGFGLKPGAMCLRQSRDFKVIYRINSLGLRDEEVGLEKKGGRRILMLGDSFTEGTGVEQEETFSAVLERKLGVEVVNAGVSGYATIQEYLWLKERGVNLQPDLVILNVNETDLVEANKYHQTKPEESVIDKIELLKLIRRGLESLRRRNSQPKTTVFIASAGTDEAAVKRYWQLMRLDVERINFLTRGKNVPLLVVFQPHGHQVSQTAWSEGRLAHGFKLDRIYPSPLPKLLEGLAEEVGFAFLDLTDAFAATEAVKLYFPYDGHWTAEGHKLTAEVTSKYLYDHSLL